MSEYKYCASCGYHRPPRQELSRDALWCAIYAAEFVRLRGVYDGEDLHRIDERMLEADKWARHLADEHVRVVLKDVAR